MKTGFRDRTKASAKPEKEAWFKGATIPYDKRTGDFVSQGSHYGVGVNQPIGSEKHSEKYAVPVGRVNTLKDDEIG